MKRVVIASAILILIFAGTLWHSFYIESFTGNLSFLLEAAEVRAEEENWQAAQELTQTAWNKWLAKDAYLHILLRHSETDNIFTGFREVAEFIQCQESGEYSAANARLISALELLSESEQFTLKNIL